MTDQDDSAAFFPSIDKNILRELDRHFRAHEPGTSPAAVRLGGDSSAPVPPAAAVPQAPEAASSHRPTADALVVAIQRTVAAITDRTDRIDELERDLNTARRARDAMATELQEARALLKASGEALQAERQGCDRAETLAGHHAKQTAELEARLATALADFQRIANAIAEIGLLRHAHNAN